VLVDSKHKPWAAAALAVLAVGGGFYAVVFGAGSEGPIAATLPGLALGLLSFGFMAAAGLLGLRRRLPTWRVGRAAVWMKVHLWIGFAALPFAFLHSGFEFGGTLTTALMVLLIAVTASGLFLLALQHILPRMLMIQVPLETIYDQIEHVSEQLLHEADERVSAVSGPLGVEPPATVGEPAHKPKVQPHEASPVLKDFYLGKVRGYLAGRTAVEAFSSPARTALLFGQVRPSLPPALHEALDDLERICEERRQLDVQSRLQAWLHGWLLLHVPLSYALLLLSAVHAIQALRF
jgi:hypothetical protein